MPLPPRQARVSPVSLRIAAVPAAAALALTWLAGGSGTAATATPEDPAAVSGPSVPASFPDPVDWEECGTGLDCATVEVPLEYTDPEGERIPLAVTRHRATDPDRRIGSLFINPGGPGVPATETVASIDAANGAGPYSPDVVARFDVVGVDPRGVGESGAVRCLTDAQRAEQATEDRDPAIPGGKPFGRLLLDARTFTEGCLDHQSPEFLASLSTDNVARDLDQVRAALGEERITFYGASYGTVVGPMYATLFPDRVRRMVIDAPVDTDLWQNDPLRLLDDVAVSNEETLDAWFETCRAEGVEVCAFGGGDPEAAFDALIADLEEEPLEVPPVEGLTPGGTLDGAMALEGVRAAAGHRVLWPTLTAGLLGAQQGDGTFLHFMVANVTVAPFGGPLAILQEPHTGVRCADWPELGRLSEHRAAAKRIAERGERLGGRAAYSALNCALWPVDNEDRFTRELTGAGAPPILVVGGRLDNVSPHHWAEAMTERLEGAVLLTREGVGHTSYRTSGPCVDDAVDAALIDGTLPANGTVCAVPPGTTRPPAPQAGPLAVGEPVLDGVDADHGPRRPFGRISTVGWSRGGGSCSGCLEVYRLSNAPAPWWKKVSVGLSSSSASVPSAPVLGQERRVTVPGAADTGPEYAKAAVGVAGALTPTRGGG
ncbi:alpha/beta hydrolase [Streptomyces radicis]|uniref:Alpha/beta hydrolase n=1 Tax=Streptomyces radicis TaxID=1750517 RepID=A0A3A9VVR6_9ACTN|nr:alpha/beta hydrolase [Streptomyces radicis]RKN25360.1 alpha/beta hydrolase [Streptomyces radicis]